MILVGVIVFLVSIISCHIIAKKRGRNPVFWGVMGEIFSPIAIPFFCISKTRG